MLLFSLSVAAPASFLRAALVALGPASACVRVCLGGGESSSLEREVEDEDDGELSERYGAVGAELLTSRLVRLEASGDESQSA